jgi:hypothetical protein
MAQISGFRTYHRVTVTQPLTPKGRWSRPITNEALVLRINTPLLPKKLARM